MSSPEGRSTPIRALAALALLTAPLVACTELRPMYADPALIGVRGDLGRSLSRIRVAPMSGRAGVELRNNLIFELTGGGSEPGSADFELAVAISTSAGSLSIEAGTGRPSSAQLVMVASYRLIRLADGRQVGVGSLSTRVPFEKTVQRFANIRAEREAEDRAARELATLLRNNVAAVLSRPLPAIGAPAGPTPAPALRAPDPATILNPGAIQRL